MECVDEFGAWHKMAPGTLHEIRTKLSSFESMTWNEILVGGQKQNHSVRIDKLVPTAAQRLIDLNLDDCEKLVSLHLSGKQRIYGIRHGATLLLLWWDPEHQIYPTEPKGT